MRVAQEFKRVSKEEPFSIVVRSAAAAEQTSPPRTQASVGGSNHALLYSGSDVLSTKEIRLTRVTRQELVRVNVQGETDNLSSIERFDTPARRAQDMPSVLFCGNV